MATETLEERARESEGREKLIGLAPSTGERRSVRELARETARAGRMGATAGLEELECESDASGEAGGSYWRERRMPAVVNGRGWPGCGSMGEAMWSEPCEYSRTRRAGSSATSSAAAWSSSVVGVPPRGEGDLLAVLDRLALSLLPIELDESLLLLEVEKVVAAGLGGAGVRWREPAPLDERDRERDLEAVVAGLSVAKGERRKSPYVPNPELGESVAGERGG